jgi:hypothetical protein
MYDISGYEEFYLLGYNSLFIILSEFSCIKDEFIECILVMCLVDAGKLRTGWLITVAYHDEMMYIII